MARHRKIPTLSANNANSVRDGKKIMLLSHALTIPLGKSCSKFNSAQWFKRRQRDGQMDGRKNKVALAYTYLAGKSSASFVKFRPVVFEEVA